MKISAAVFCLAAMAVVCASATEVSAAGRRAARMEAYQATPAGNGMTILPSAAEIAAVPVPRQGAVVAYPVDVVRYGLTIHPGARIVRGIFAR